MKREAEATRLVGEVAQERERLDTRDKHLASGEQALLRALAVAVGEREKDILSEVDRECRQRLVAATVHVFSHIA